MNVVVLALRGCPISALGPYGNEAVGTPHLDRLAAEGIVFDRHISDSPDPAAARRAWRTGQHAGTPTPAPTDLLPLLTSAGVRTVLVRHTREANDPPAEFLGDWSEIVDARPDPADRAPADALLRLLPALLARLADRTPWLLWIEIDTLLPPWDVPQEVFEAYVEDLLEDQAEPEPPESEGSEDAPEFLEEELDPSPELEAESDEEPEDLDEPEESEEVEDSPEPEEPQSPPAEPILPWRNPETGWFDTDDLASWELLHRSFAAAVTSFDADLGRIFAVFREHALDRTAAWIFTADHGFPLGEHGVIGLHRPWLYEEFVHVPLIVRLPDAAEATSRIDALTQPADLMPTLARWYSVETPEKLDGFPLQPLILGEVESLRDAAISRLRLDSAEEWAIRTPRWTLLCPIATPPDDDPRPVLLFEKPDDRWEVNDVRSQHPDLAEELESQLRGTLPQT